MILLSSRPPRLYTLAILTMLLLGATNSKEALADQPTPLGEPVVKPAAPTRFVADLSLDAQANTYAFKRKQATFALELSPRFGVLVADFLDVGLNFIAGYGGSTKVWSQSTMFGVGPYVGSKLPLSANWRVVPWVAVLYHQSFLSGFVPGSDTMTSPGDDVSGVRQIVRLDAHVDFVFHPASKTGLSIGGFVKNRLASFDSGLGQAHEIDGGIRLGAVSYF